MDMRLAVCAAAFAAAFAASCAEGAVKAFDPAPDGKSFLVTTAKTKWWTDSLEICTLGEKDESAAFTPSLVIPGAKIYKARWVK